MVAGMRAVYAESLNPEAPLDGLVVGERPEPEVPAGWSKVAVKAASLNHHDLWTLRGVGITADRLPMILGCDAAGIDTATGDEVVVHSVIATDGWAGDETLDPGRTLLSEKHQGSLAEFVIVPTRNLVPKPAELSFVDAACLPTAWLTAYRMLFFNAALLPGQTVLVQGASGGVATACIAMARAAGYRVWVTARSEDKGDHALALGAHAAFSTGARLPERVDAVMETVGEATWSHSLKSLKPGGKLVISGATTGSNPPADLSRIFFLQLQILGSTMGTREQLRELMSFLRNVNLRPHIYRTLPLEAARDGLEAMASGELIGKIVLEV
jgi:NADPH:quinone reductase-like Zn-dependent oxidoreductase